MPPEIASIPTGMFVLLVVGFALGISFEKFLAKQRRAEWRQRNAWRWKKKGGKAGVPPKTKKAGPLVDSSDQLRTVMAAEFTVQPLLNKGEARVFQELDRMVIARNPGWQVMAQVSLGEMLRCKDRGAYGCINSKRVDLVLMDEKCHARHAIEYQGGGHYLTDAAARDAVKKEALRKAGIGYHERAYDAGGIAGTCGEVGACCVAPRARKAEQSERALGREPRRIGPGCGAD